MFTFTVKIDPTVGSDIAKGGADLIRNVAFAIEAELKILMTGAKHGRIYRKKGGRIHQASAPGEPPAVDTGHLIGSIQTVIKSPIEAEIIIPAEYAQALEFGTSRMAARPFVRPAIAGVLQRFGRGGILASARE